MSPDRDPLEKKKKAKVAHWDPDKTANLYCDSKLTGVEEVVFYSAGTRTGKVEPHHDKDCTWDNVYLPNTKCVRYDLGDEPRE